MGGWKRGRGIGETGDGTGMEEQVMGPCGGWRRGVGGLRVGRGVGGE